jgi:ribosome-binding protein aMBF1 (putative translation factor)
MSRDNHAAAIKTLLLHWNKKWPKNIEIAFWRKRNGLHISVIDNLRSSTTSKEDLSCLERKIRRLSEQPRLLIRKRREKLGWTLRVLAEKAQVDESNLSALENGRRPLGMKMARLLSRLLEIPVEQLCFESVKND